MSQRSGDPTLTVEVTAADIANATNDDYNLSACVAVKREVQDVGFIGYSTASPEFNIDGVVYFADAGTLAIANAELQGIKPPLPYTANFSYTNPVLLP